MTRIEEDNEPVAARDPEEIVKATQNYIQLLAKSVARQIVQEFEAKEAATESGAKSKRRVVAKTAVNAGSKGRRT